MPSQRAEAPVFFCGALGQHALPKLTSWGESTILSYIPLAMNLRTRRTGWMVWGGLMLLGTTLLLALLLAQLQSRNIRNQLPIYGSVADFTLSCEKPVESMKS